MEKSSCVSCLKPKATLTCGLCEESVCKYCAQFIGENSFSFLAEVPKALSHSTYCMACFDGHVAAEVERYNNDLEKAKDITVFDTNQGKETRNFKRPDKSYKVEDCPDREETLLRLAFLAVRDGYNGLVDVDITHKKVRNGSYQSHIYSGTGTPAHITSRKR